jgi:hypothetical protein
LVDEDIGRTVLRKGVLNQLVFVLSLKLPNGVTLELNPFQRVLFLPVEEGIVAGQLSPHVADEPCEVVGMQPSGNRIRMEVFYYSTLF